MADLIDRQAAIEAVRRLGFKQTSTVKSIICALEVVPAAKPKRGEGRWIVRMQRGNWSDREQKTCSECGMTFVDLDVANFCPNCGLPMEV